MAGPLENIRVLDFTHALAGPFGTMVLADLGAEVISVERVDVTEVERGPGPYVNGRGVFRLSLDRGKRSVQIDLHHPEGVDLALRLAARSDVLAENFTPGVMDRLGLGYDAVRAGSPHIIYASLSGFGATGPDAGRGALDIIAQATSGLMSLTGEPGGPPLRAGASLGDSLGGVYLALGVLAALHERERTGLGRRLDVSMQESVLYHLENAVVRHSVTGETPGRTGSRHPFMTPFQAFETTDGWIAVAGVRDWEGFCTALDVWDMARDPRFADNDSRTEHHAALEPRLRAAFAARSTEEWLGLLEGICLAARVMDIGQVVDDPHLQERGAFLSLPVPGPEPRTVAVPRTPVRMGDDASPDPAPALGEHTNDVLQRVLGLSWAEVVSLRQAGVIGPQV